MYFKQTKFLIIGISRSGFSATEQLLKIKAKCFVFDNHKTDLVLENIAKLVAKGAIEVMENEIETVVKNIDCLLLSPGVPIDNKVAVLAKQHGIRIIGELELGYMLSASPIIAITGTNGKTTTSSIIHSALKANGENSILCGNVGTPITAVANELDYNSIGVVEVSSFQLETVFSFTPHIAIILNITPDHLSRHYNMENYMFVKSRIFMNMRESEFLILNYDDEAVRNLSVKSNAKVVFFSTKTEVDGAYISSGKIYYKGKYIVDISQIPLNGEHNLQNVLASIIALKILNVSNKKLVEALTEFKGIKHRLELVRKVNDVSYINDSKATNIDATLKAIQSMDKQTVLILGGKDKGISYVPLFKEIIKSNVANVIITGESTYAMLDTAKQLACNICTIANDLETAIKLSSLIAKPNTNVLFSPACSSFDKFKNYEERGEFYCSIVNTL